jgi:hypothetical protein
VGETVEPLRVRKAECSLCKGPRNCEVKGEFTQTGDEEAYQWRTTWYVLQCRGCEHVFVQTVSTNSEDVDQSYDEKGDTVTEYNETIRYWPALSKRPLPEWMSEFGIDAEEVERLDEALIELYGALNNDLNILAAIGVRTCFDIASELLGIDPQQSFKYKLEELVKSGHIGVLDKSRLETLVDAGSASVHRGWRPKAEDLATMMDALEHFIHDAFVAPCRKKRLDAKIVRMKDAVPARKVNRT